jgi:cytochrome c553
MAGSFSPGRGHVAALLLLWLASQAAAGTPNTASAKFFEEKVRPVLVTRCVACHGAAKQKGGLRLDSFDAMARGGSGGAAIQPGHAEESLLIRAVRQTDDLKMPPSGKLPAVEIANLAAWIQAGAPWPDAAPVAVVSPGGNSLFGREQKEFWAFLPPVAASPPEVRDAARVRNPIDRFILAGLESRGLHPMPLADRRTLIRRVTLDLTGLPPRQEEVAEFLADQSENAFAKVVDRLLASTAYGERWGRRWLDVARYADSNGMDENLAFAHSWRYRDYVVNAFNHDKPFDRFVQEQIAGDLLPAASEAERMDGIVATGFLTVGPKMLAEDDPVKMQMDIVDEQLDTVGQAFLGLTLGCARCHDHKFDPIPTADYYSLAGIFKSTQTMDTFTVVANWHERPLADDAAVQKYKEHEARIASIRKRLTTLERGSAGIKATVGTIGFVPVAKQLRALKNDLVAAEKSRPDLPMAMAVADGKVEDLPIHVRGSHLTLGPVVPRRFPRILAGEDQRPLDAKQSGRLQLARWLTRPDNPLTARVFVNRVWLGHFGEGLVRTPDNFGRLGERPTNQALLDWLAVQFVQNGWSVKQLHRLIVLSSSYQMSTAYDAAAARADPDNRLQWRMNRRRMDAEQLRDSILAVSGGLDRTMGGSLLNVADHRYVSVHANFDRYNSQRRSLYLPVVRSDVYNVFQAFDFADPSLPNGRRETTTVAPQALFMLNGKLVREECERLARSLLVLPGDDSHRVSAAYDRLYSRVATNVEVENALRFVTEYEQELAWQKVAEGERRPRAWQGLCRVLLASNEFVFIE